MCRTLPKTSVETFPVDLLPASGLRTTMPTDGAKKSAKRLSPLALTPKCICVMLALGAPLLLRLDFFGLTEVAMRCSSLLSFAGCNAMS